MESFGPLTLALLVMIIGLAGTMQAAGLATNSAAGTGLHFAPRAKRVIYLFMNGGPSHVDTFDPKPALKDHEGEVPDKNTMRKKKGGFVPSPFAFAPHGKSGVVLSELFPNLAHMDLPGKALCPPEHIDAALAQLRAAFDEKMKNRNPADGVPLLLFEP